MNKYLAAIVILLSLMVFDQAYSLKKLKNFSDLQGKTIDDYWDMLQKCNK